MRFALTLCLLAGISNLACSSRIDVRQYPSARFFVDDDRLENPSQLPPMRIYRLDTGHHTTLESFLFSGGSWFTTREISFAVAFIEHPEGLLLIDTGLGPDIDQQYSAEMPFLLKGLVSYSDAFDPRAQLEVAGIDPDKVKHILLTHPHWDHAGGIESFPGAEVWHPRAGYEEAVALAEEESAFFAEQYDADSIRWNFHGYPDGPYENFTESLDFFDDGSVVLVPMRGHTSSSVGVFVNNSDGERYFFTGDTTWAVEGFERPSHKFWFSKWLVDGNAAAMEFPIVQVHQLMKAYPNLHVLPSHDARAWTGITPLLVLKSDAE